MEKPQVKHPRITSTFALASETKRQLQWLKRNAPGGSMGHIIDRLVDAEYKRVKQQAKSK